MTDAWATAVAAFIGAVASLAGVWLSHFLQARRSNKLAELRKERLCQLLKGQRYVWRSLDTLCAAVGADKETTCELLLEIGARASVTNAESWALVERAPWPQDLQPTD